MNIYVISLIDAKKRREQSFEQLLRQNIEFEFFDALTPDKAREEIFPTISLDNEKEFVLNTGRTYTPGELGCYASHVALWKKCIELNEPIFIMEDDFYAEASFKQALSHASTHIDELGFIRLQDEKRAKSRPVRFLNNRDQIVYYVKVPHCCMGYAISPKVAQAFLDKMPGFTEPVDVFIKKTWLHRQPIYGLKPYPLKDSPLSRQTTIKFRVKAQKKLKVQWDRLLKKTAWQIKRRIFNLEYFTRSVI